MKVTTLSDYGKLVYGWGDNEDIDAMYTDENTGETWFDTPEADAVSKIIALQVAYYTLRRMPYSCQSISDEIYHQISVAKTEYETLTSKEYSDPNEGTDY